MDKCCKVAALYIASLRALSIIHQQNHWTTCGKDFYGNHLLFERIYKSAVKNLDLSAEKFIGLFGNECFDYDMQAKLLNSVLSRYNKFDVDPIKMSLAVENDFLKLSTEAFNCFKQKNKLSLGLDDMIMSISSDREESVYLLKRVLS